MPPPPDARPPDRLSLDPAQQSRAELDCAPGHAVATRAQQIARVVLAAILVGLGAWTLQGYLPALAWAVIFAISGWPLYQRARRRWSGAKAEMVLPVLFSIAIGLLFMAPLALAAIEIGREAHGVAEWVHAARNTGIAVPEWVEGLPIGGEQAARWWQENLADPTSASDLLGRLDHDQLINFGKRFGTIVVHRLVLFFFTMVTLFFLFRQGDALKEQILVASRRAFGPSGERLGRQIVASVRGTVDGLVLVGIGEGAVLGFAYVVLGVPHPALLGGMTAVAAMIPFGAPLLFGLAALLLLGQGATASAIGLLIFGMIVVFVADHAVRPVLIGGATRLPFLWVLLGILGGVETWGLIGLFLGPAIMAALILLWREWTAASAASVP